MLAFVLRVGCLCSPVRIFYGTTVRFEESGLTSVWDSGFYTHGKAETNFFEKCVSEYALARTSGSTHTFDLDTSFKYLFICFGLVPFTASLIRSLLNDQFGTMIGNDRRRAHTIGCNSSSDATVNGLRTVESLHFTTRSCTVN